MSAQNGNITSMMEDSNVGPGIGAHPRRSTTPDSSESSAAPSYATAAEHIEDQADQAGIDLVAVSVQLQEVQIGDQLAGNAKIEGHAIDQQDIGNVEELPAYAPEGVAAEYNNNRQQDVVSEHDDPQIGGLPQIHTITGALADLTTGVRQFPTWDDYKLMCLAAPKIMLVLDEAGGQVKLACSRKLLMDFSDTFKLMNLIVGEDELNITGLFEDLPIKSVAATFIQLYEMMQSGGLPVPVSGDVSFARLIELFIMADFLVIPWVKDWLGTYVQARIQELSATWMHNYETARMLEAVPEDQRAHAGHISPLQVQAAKLLDVQEAFLHARFNPRAKVVLPSQLARLVSDHCPAELRLQVQTSGHMRAEFLRALSMYDLKRRVEARRGIGAGNHH